MSSMIMCDRCKSLFYTDSKSDKDAYCNFNIEYIDGLSHGHLCKKCHSEMLINFLKSYTYDEYVDAYGSIENE